MSDEHNVTALVSSYEALCGLSDADVEDLRAAHEAELVKVAGKISAAFATPGSGPYRNKMARVASLLRLHLEWIKRDIARRERIQRKAEVAVKHEAHMAFVAEERAKRRQRADQVQAQLREEAKNRAAREALKLASIAAANNETARQIAVFKAVCREVMGDEMYLHLWELTRIRMEAAA